MPPLDPDMVQKPIDLTNRGLSVHHSSAIRRGVRAVERRVSNGHLSVVEAAVGRVPVRVALFTCGPTGAIGRAVGLPGDGVLIDAVGLNRLAVGVADRGGLGALSEVLGPLFGAHTLVVACAPLFADHAGISEIVVDAGADGLVVVGRVVSRPRREGERPRTREPTVRLPKKRTAAMIE